MDNRSSRADARQKIGSICLFRGAVSQGFSLGNHRIGFCHELIVSDRRASVFEARANLGAKPGRRARLKPYRFPPPHESFSVTARLNTGAPGFESTRSATK